MQNENRVGHSFSYSEHWWKITCRCVIIKHTGLGICWRSTIKRILVTLRSSSRKFSRKVANRGASFWYFLNESLFCFPRNVWNLTLNECSPWEARHVGVSDYVKAMLANADNRYMSSVRETALIVAIVHHKYKSFQNTLRSNPEPCD